jgi:hypothetical protein
MPNTDGASKRGTTAGYGGMLKGIDLQFRERIEDVQCICSETLKV